tara:strand:- start:2092 stop:2544 length:453 start_codon:yes stop_codon:yes gene_type:complete
MGNFKNWIGRRSQKPKTVEVEILGPTLSTEHWDVEKAEELLPLRARFVSPRRLGKPKIMYCVFKSGPNYYPIPLDRKQAVLADKPEEFLEKITATTEQVYHMEKQQVRRKRYSRRGSAMQKAQATMYVLLAGGLGFLLFIIFSEVTDGAN